MSRPPVVVKDVPWMEVPPMVPAVMLVAVSGPDNKVPVERVNDASDWLVRVDTCRDDAPIDAATRVLTFNSENPSIFTLLIAG